MFKTLNKLFFFLDSELKISAAVIFILIILSMIIETISIGLIIPAITLLSENNLVEKYPFFLRYYPHYLP